MDSDGISGAVTIYSDGGNIQNDMGTYSVDVATNSQMWIQNQYCLTFKLLQYLLTIWADGWWKKRPSSNI